MANAGKAQCSKCGTFCKAASMDYCTTVLPDGQKCGGCLIPTYMVQRKGKVTQVYKVSATSDPHLSCCAQECNPCDGTVCGFITRALAPGPFPCPYCKLHHDATVSTTPHACTL